MTFFRRSKYGQGAKDEARDKAGEEVEAAATVPSSITVELTDDEKKDLERKGVEIGMPPGQTTQLVETIARGNTGTINPTPLAGRSEEEIKEFLNAVYAPAFSKVIKRIQETSTASSSRSTEERESEESEERLAEPGRSEERGSEETAERITSESGGRKHSRKNKRSNKRNSRKGGKKRKSQRKRRR